MESVEKSKRMEEHDVKEKKNKKMRTQKTMLQKSCKQLIKTKSVKYNNARP